MLPITLGHFIGRYFIGFWHAEQIPSSIIDFKEVSDNLFNVTFKMGFHLALASASLCA